MSAPTENTAPLTPEMEGAIRHALESHLLGLGLHAGESLEHELGITSGDPHLFAIGRLGRKLTLCAEVLSDARTFSLIDLRDDVGELLKECEREAEDSLEREQREPGYPEDLALARARLTLLAHTIHCLQLRAEAVTA